MKSSWAFILPAALLVFIPVSARANSGDFNGGVAIGSSYAGIDAAPTNGLIVQGNVGIGTTSATTALHIVSASSSGNAPFITIENTSGATPSTFGPGIEILNDVSGQHGFLLEQQQDSVGNLAFSDPSSPYTQYVVLSQGGNVGIANKSPSYLLHVGSSSASGIVMELQNSSGACTYSPGASSVTVSCSSDRRLKHDIEDSTFDAISWIEDLRLRDFTVNATGERKTGVVAQEVMVKHPEMVHRGNDGAYSVDEPDPWKLAKAIQEQQTEIDHLKQTIEQLKQQR